MAETASLTIDGWPRDMFLVDDQVVVFSNVYIPRKIEGDHPICAPGGGIAADAYCGYWASDVTQITTVDVSDLSQPKITAEILLPGSYLSARRIDQRVRVVMSDTLPFPDGIRYWPDLPPGATPSSATRRSTSWRPPTRRSSAAALSTTGSGRVRSASPAAPPLRFPTPAPSSPSAPRRPGRAFSPWPPWT